MRRFSAVLVVGALACACTAKIDGNSPYGDAAANGSGASSGTGGIGTNPQTVDPTKPPSAEVTCQAGATDVVGHRVLRRLTNDELETTVRAVLGLDATQWPGVDLPSDAGSQDGFTNNVDSLTVGPDYAKGTLDGAKKLASLVSADPTLSKLAPCASTGDAACASTFVETLGEKLYRRPLTDAEKARYTALYTKITQHEDFHAFAYWATTAMLQSPYLIYRSEIGDPDAAAAGHYKLSSFEVATELAYTFTGGPPTAELAALAKSNQLSTADQIEAAARTLVFDGQQIRPAFRDLLLRFSEQWLGLSGFENLKKDAMLYPSFSADVQTSMAEEMRRFFAGVVLEDRGSAASLFTAPYTYVDANLAQYYGFGTASSSDFVRATRPANMGVGILAQGTLLATQANSLTTSPTRRGHLIRTKLLCGVVPPPPPVVGPIPAPTKAKTTRQRYEELHTANASCKACHSMMDNIGFALEHLDSAGRYRDTENDFPIDASGIVSGTTSGDLHVNGEADLANQLSALPEATSCVSSYLAGYALGLGHDSAACLVGTAAAELKAGGSVLDYYVRISRAEHFRSRQ